MVWDMSPYGSGGLCSLRPIGPKWATIVSKAGLRRVLGISYHRGLLLPHWGHVLYWDHSSIWYMVLQKVYGPCSFCVIPVSSELQYPFCGLVSVFMSS